MKEKKEKVNKAIGRNEEERKKKVKQSNWLKRRQKKKKKKKGVKPTDETHVQVHISIFRLLSSLIFFLQFSSHLGEKTFDAA